MWDCNGHGTFVLIVLFRKGLNVLNLSVPQREEKK